MSGGEPRARGAIVRTTARLVLRRLTPDDAPFAFELLRSPGWLRFIGDRHVHTITDAGLYLERVPIAQYARLGYGLYRVELALDGTPVGLCGIVRREALEDPDLGFALLERHTGRGYALEAAREVVAHAREDVGLARLAAIVRPDNGRSIALLEKLGMRYERLLRLPGEEQDVRLYGLELESRSREDGNRAGAGGI